MGIEIRDEIKSAAKWCNKKVSCVSFENPDLCKITVCINEKIHFVANKELKDCAYQNSLGHGKCCTCPVRKEIYNEYRK